MERDQENLSLTMNVKTRSRSKNHRDDTEKPQRTQGEKRSRRTDSSGSSNQSYSSTGGKKKERETDPEVLQRRQKQIDYGKNNLAYDNYVAKIPKMNRPFYLPRTPDK